MNPTTQLPESQRSKPTELGRREFIEIQGEHASAKRLFAEPTKLALKKNEIHLWITFPEQITSTELLLAYTRLLTEEEQIKWKKFHFSRHRHQYLVTRAMVKNILSQYLQISPLALRFGRNQYGKPEIANEDIIQPLRFNLSHTAGMIICGVTLENDIGVDVENLTRETQALELAIRFFSRKEAEELSALPRKEQNLRFYEYWVLKESYIKACGSGLFIELDHIAFDLHNGNQINISFAAKQYGQARNWKFWLIDHGESHKIGIGLHADQPARPCNVIFRHCTPFMQSKCVDYPHLCS